MAGSTYHAQDSPRCVCEEIHSSGDDAFDGRPRELVWVDKDNLHSVGKGVQALSGDIMIIARESRLPCARGSHHCVGTTYYHTWLTQRRPLSAKVLHC